MRVASARKPQTIIAVLAGLLLMAAVSPFLFNMSVSAEEPQSEQSAIVISHTLYPRWSAVGVPSSVHGVDILEAFAENTSDDGDISGRVTAVYRWNGATQTWTVFFPSGIGVPGVNDFSTFTGNTAYWIAITPGAPVVWTPAGQD